MGQAVKNLIGEKFVRWNLADGENTELPLPSTFWVLVLFLPEDLLSLVATHNHVIEPTLKLYPRFPGHGIKSQLSTLNVNI